MKKKILIVDDDTFFVNKILSGCNGSGVSFSIADSLNRAKMYMSLDKFDLILANVKVPGGNSMDLKLFIANNDKKTSFLFMSDLDADYSHVKNTGEMCCHKYELQDSLMGYLANA